MRIVLIHGLAESARVFHRLAPLLVGHEVLAVELPGHGRDAANEGAESIEEMAGAVRDEVTEPSVFVGHSMGGLVAAAVAEQAPELVERLVLVNSPPTVASRLTAHRGGEGLLRRSVIGALAWRVMGEGAVRRGLSSAVAPGTEVPQFMVDDLRRLSWKTFVHATAAVDWYVHESSLQERVAELGLPTTVIFGEQDQRVDIATLDDYSGEHVEIVRLPDAGHSPILETPESVAAAVLSP